MGKKPTGAGIGAPCAPRGQVGKEQVDQGLFDRDAHPSRRPDDGLSQLNLAHRAQDHLRAAKEGRQLRLACCLRVEVGTEADEHCGARPQSKEAVEELPPHVAATCGEKISSNWSTTTRRRCGVVPPPRRPRCERRPSPSAGTPSWGRLSRRGKARGPGEARSLASSPRKTTGRARLLSLPAPRPRPEAKTCRCRRPLPAPHRSFAARPRARRDGHVQCCQFGGRSVRNATRLEHGAESLRLSRAMEVLAAAQELHQGRTVRPALVRSTFSTSATSERVLTRSGSGLLLNSNSGPSSHLVDQAPCFPLRFGGI